MSDGTWMIVELMGRKVVAGLVREETRFGSTWMRIDVPDVPGQTGFTSYYGASALYGFRPVDEATARRVAAGLREPPVEPWRLRQLEAPDSERPGETGDPDYQDHDDDDESRYEDEDEEDIPKGPPCGVCRGEGVVVPEGNVEGDDSEDCEACDGSGVEQGATETLRRGNDVLESHPIQTSGGEVELSTQTITESDNVEITGWSRPGGPVVAVEWSGLGASGGNQDDDGWYEEMIALAVPGSPASQRERPPKGYKLSILAGGSDHTLWRLEGPGIERETWSDSSYNSYEAGLEAARAHDQERQRMESLEAFEASRKSEPLPGEITPDYIPKDDEDIPF